MPDLVCQGLAPCRAYFTSFGGGDIGLRIRGCRKPPGGGPGRHQGPAPAARVFVIGSPGLLPAAPTADCSLTLAIAKGDLTFVDSEERQLNETLREQAAAAGASYVDTQTPSAAHGACAAPAARWTEPLLQASPAAPMHPTRPGGRTEENVWLPGPRGHRRPARQRDPGSGAGGQPGLGG